MREPRLDTENREVKDRCVTAEVSSQTEQEGARLARIVMAVDLTDRMSRSRARQTVDQFGEGGISATRSRMLGKQLRSLAWADAKNSKAMADMQRLAVKVRQLGLPKSGRGQKGIVGRLFGFSKKKLDRLNASREELEAMVASLSGSAESLRQSEVALDGFEADIRAERDQITRDIALADAFESALVAAVNEARANADLSDVVRFAESEVLFYLEQHRGALQALNAVNQQAALSLSILRETNDALLQNMRLVTFATRHALDVATMLRRPHEVSGDDRDGATDAQAGMEALQDSLRELAQALDRHDAWRTSSAARREDALLELQGISERASRDGDYA